MDRLWESSRWAFFECDSARLGIAGASIVGTPTVIRVPALVADRLGLLSKKPAIPELTGMFGVTGDDSVEDVSGDERGVPKKLRSMVEKSESWFELMDEPEDDVEIDRMSGALRACTFVVDNSSVGREIWFRSIVPFGYLTVAARTTIDVSWVRLVRLVKARARATVEEGMLSRE